MYTDLLTLARGVCLFEVVAFDAESLVAVALGALGGAISVQAARLAVAFTGCNIK
jgi:hypothetical protein